MVSVKNKVEKLAQQHSIDLSYLWTGNLARAITSLADDKIEQDDTERMLILLKQKGFLDNEEFGDLLV